MTKPSAKPGKCPICNKPTQEATKPFCSVRCKQVDLNKWLSGSYSVPAVEEEFSETDMSDLENPRNMH
ncbi:DNA gyrase inhibitor YacG [Pseudovibrio japonicus]|uniref:DNA gyrase inhibitor YacG n=1 Tax=Pseudovibrio japonicus TaxID=366534 RepID=UPI001675DDEC|nr:DNA gyrase inhibitor YacG [Pseudovibrio japonicus]